MASNMEARNGLSNLDLSTAKEVEKRRKRKKRWKEGGRTRIAREVRAGNRKPPTVPEGLSLLEIDCLPDDDVRFKDESRVGGGPRPVGEDWRTTVRADKQGRAVARRARARKYEAKVMVAQQVMEGHVSHRQETEMDVYDEDRAVAEGILNLDDWDDEELIRGYRRNRNGKFGAPPRYIPREIEQEMFRRIVHRGERKFRKAYLASIEGLIQLAHSASSEKVRLEAQKELMNRTVGKIPDVVIAGTAKPWEELLVDTIVPISELPPIDLEVGDDGVARIDSIPTDDGALASDDRASERPEVLPVTSVPAEPPSSDPPIGGTQDPPIGGTQDPPEPEPTVIESPLVVELPDPEPLKKTPAPRRRTTLTGAKGKGARKKPATRSVKTTTKGK